MASKQVGAYASGTFSSILTPSLEQRFQAFLKVKGPLETQLVSPVLQNLLVQTGKCQHQLRFPPTTHP